MSLSYDILGTPGTAADVSLHQLDQTKLVWVGAKTDPDGSTVNTYIMNDSDPAYPVTVTIRTQTDNKARQRKFTLVLNTWARSTDSVSGALVYRPIQTGFFDAVPTDVSVEAADLSALWANCFGLTFKTLTSKVRDTSIVADALFGVGHVW
jgi:hypothetical protein